MLCIFSRQVQHLSQFLLRDGSKRKSQAGESEGDKGTKGKQIILERCKWTI